MFFTAHARIKLFTTSVLFFHIIGGSYLFSQYLEGRLTVYKNDPLEATIYLSSSRIEVTTDETSEHTIHKTILNVTVTNHSLDRLTNVLLILPSIGLKTLETPTAKRITNLPQQADDEVFSLGNISSGSSKKATVWIYSMQKKTYTIKAYIETKEKFSKTTNAIKLEVE